MYLIIIFVFYSFASFSANHLTFLGGGGEPKKLPTTIFDASLPALNKFVTDTSNSWKYDIHFNGGHADTENSVKTNFKYAETKQNFTKDSLPVSVAKYIDNIKSGKIKAGDQIMVLINTHGSLKSDQTNTHFLAAGAAEAGINLQNLSGADKLVNVDGLKELTALANKNGIKLAIVDFSCYSGNTLNLANENTCVVSGAGSKHFSYATFGPNFINKMKSGKSLESVFIEARSSQNDNSYPMISTPEGLEINNLVYEHITPYLYYETNFGDGAPSELSKYVELAAAKPEVCKYETNFEKLEKQLDSLNSLVDLNTKAEAKKEIDILKNKISNYKKTIDKKIAVATALGAKDIEIGEITGIADYERVKYTIKSIYSAREILEINYKKLISGLEEALSETIRKSVLENTKAYDIDIGGYMAKIQMHKTAEKKSEEILAKNPDFKNYKKKFADSMKDIEGTTGNAVGDIVKQERKVYDLIYKQKMEKSVKKNACRDFIL